MGVNWPDTTECIHKACQECGGTLTNKEGGVCEHPLFVCYCPEHDNNIKCKKTAEKDIKKLKSGIIKRPDLNKEDILVEFESFGRQYSATRESWSEVKSLIDFAIFLE